MYPLIGLSLVLVTVLLLAVFGLVRSASAAEPAKPAPAAPPVTAAAVKGLDKTELQRMLSRLVQAPPSEPKPIAMCYAPIPPRQRAEYICPTCGARTFYVLGTNSTDNAVNHLVSVELDYARRAAQQIRTNTLAVTLVETALCRKCAPDVKKPALALRVVFADRSERLVPDITPADVGLLRDFLAGRTTLSDSTESPLKDSLPRLRELLGFTPPATNAPALKQ